MADRFTPKQPHISTIALAAQQALSAEYLTTPALAEFVGKSHRTIDRWRRERISPPFLKVGNTVLFPVDGVREWLKRREVDLDAKARGRRS